jgi:hypothetical protein
MSYPADRESATTQTDKINEALDAIKKLPAHLHAEGGALVMLAAINANLSRIADVLYTVTNSDRGFVWTREVGDDY